MNDPQNNPNIPLIIFDLFFLPIMICRIIIIFFTGSLYRLKGMEFLDILHHASGRYFGYPVVQKKQNICESINQSTRNQVSECKTVDSAATANSVGPDSTTVSELESDLDREIDESADSHSDSEPFIRQTESPMRLCPERRSPGRTHNIGVNFGRRGSTGPFHSDVEQTGPKRPDHIDSDSADLESDSFPAVRISEEVDKFFKDMD